MHLAVKRLNYAVNQNPRFIKGGECPALNTLDCSLSYPKEDAG